MRPWPERWLASALTGPQSPTAALYFENACGDWLADGRVTRLAPTVFASDTAVLVVRHDGGVPKSIAGRRLVYLIDDDWSAAPGDPAVPRAFRWKYRLVEHRAARFYLPRADDVIVSTPALAAAARVAAPRATVHVVSPYWSETPRALDHHGTEPVRIAYLGAQVHREDFRFLAPVLSRVLAAHPQVELALSANHALPADLAATPRLTRIPATSWRDYRSWLAGASAHLALYPLLDTPFNRARSASKLGEHGVIGAATLASDTWPAGVQAAETGRVALAANTPTAWEQAISALLRDPDGLRAIAEANRNAILADEVKDRHRALFAELMLG